ncbi:response regulator [candidate division KSB1 bacterium]|nr:response regulator [candidate division KSB1 bacterium]
MEDDIEDVQILNRIIKNADPENRSDLEILHCSSLADGLQELTKNSIDAVLLDLSLPDGFGISTFEKVHKHFPNIPIVVLSSLDDEHLAMKAVKMGAQDYLVK